jgi:hypothetical protein
MTEAEFAETGADVAGRMTEAELAKEGAALAGTDMGSKILRDSGLEKTLLGLTCFLARSQG